MKKTIYGSYKLDVDKYSYEQTDFYKDIGYIGYSVRPTQRRKGYAKQMLNEVLKLAKEHNLKDIK